MMRKPTDFAAWKSHVTILTCLLRLRIQPQAPYSEIASFLLNTWHEGILMLSPSTTFKLAAQTPELDNQDPLQRWVLWYLPRLFKHAEEEGGEAWVTVRAWDDGVVRRALERMGWKSKYIVAAKEEVEVQILWRMVGDWREGSVPLEKGEEDGERVRRLVLGMGVAVRKPEVLRKEGVIGVNEENVDNDSMVERKMERARGDESYLRVGAEAEENALPLPLQQSEKASHEKKVIKKKAFHSFSSQIEGISSAEGRANQEDRNLSHGTTRINKYTMYWG